MWSFLDRVSSTQNLLVEMLPDSGTRAFLGRAPLSGALLVGDSRLDRLCLEPPQILLVLGPATCPGWVLEYPLPGTPCPPA